jgi:hypothetical protein
MRRLILLAAAGFSASAVQAQKPTLANGLPYDQQLNTITTAVPFLLISPDSRSGAMGDAGVGLSPDPSSMFWNPAKLAFSKKQMEFAVGFTPWLKALVPDINLAYLSGYKKIDDYSAVGASLRFFSLGSITFTDINGSTIREFKPSEFSIDVAYARKLTDHWSVSMTGKFIYSNLTGGVPSGAAQTRAGLAGAADLGGYYTKDDFYIGGKKAEIGVGITMNNIGNKMSYTSTSNRDFLPANLRLGQALTIHADDYNKFTIATDVYRLLVPTPPLIAVDANGVPMLDPSGNYVLASGKDPNRGVAAGIFGSFTDAPGFVMPDENGRLQYDAEGNVILAKGSKFREEMREFNLCLGAEYWYNNQFAIRSGFFYEHPTKGNRQFISMGAGIRYSVFNLDLSYLVPVRQRHPLANTIRFTLLISLKESDKKKPSGV